MVPPAQTATWGDLNGVLGGKEGKEDWEERQVALLELVVTLFCTVLKQDRIAKAVVCYKENLRARREVVPGARDNPDSFHLFATSVGCMPRSRMFFVKEYRIKRRLSLNVRPAGPTTTCLSNTYLLSCLPAFLSSWLPNFLTS